MRRRTYFYPYCIQIGNNPDILAVNYSTNVARSLAKFRHAHPRIKNSRLRPELYEHLPATKNPTQAIARTQELVRDLEAEGFEVIAGPPLYTNEWRCYVIQIGGNDNHVYVGQTNYPIEKRFQQHIYKYHSARALNRQDILTLREDLFAHLRPSYTQAASLVAEKALYQDLKKRGFKVEGGT